MDEQIVDFHVHSKYSRATSRIMDLNNMYKWSKLKGINVIATGDITHPIWLKDEVIAKLEPAEQGLFCLKKKYRDKIDKELPEVVRENYQRFILTVEISSIYKRHDKVRKVHSLIIFPHLKAVHEFNLRLGRIGNLRSDGRPILGLDVYDLLKLCLEVDPDILFVPAHIWTPWFSLHGSKSGFDSIEEAFGDLAGHIKVIETGLSSDPFMNWRVKHLDNVALMSNSDAHSPMKLGREANIFKLEDISYKAITKAVSTNSKEFIGTIEFFPQEGKYHYDGHRLCNIVLSPEQTIKLKGICPKCHKPLVIGVEHRVNELSAKDRPAGYKPVEHKKVEYIIPLMEILAELKNLKSPNSKSVQQEYFNLVATYGSEFDILRKVNPKDVIELELAVAIDKLRKQEVFVQPGYDGVYGIIKINPVGKRQVLAK